MTDHGNLYKYAYSHWREHNSLPADLEPKYLEELVDAASRDAQFESFLRQEIEMARAECAIRT